MAMPEEEKNDVYYIPGNYEDAGGIFGGRVRARNFIELVIFCGPLLGLEYLLPLGGQTKIMLMIVTGLPLAFLCVFGINGETLTQSLISIVRFHRNKRKLSYINFTCANSKSSFSMSFDDLLNSLATVGFKATYNAYKAQRESDKKNKQTGGVKKNSHRPAKPTKAKRVAAQKLGDQTPSTPPPAPKQAQPVIAEKQASVMPTTPPASQHTKPVASTKITRNDTRVSVEQNQAVPPETPIPQSTPTFVQTAQEMSATKATPRREKRLAPARVPKAKRQGKLLSGAFAESLLRKLELTDDDEDI